jgi:tRNA A-37 threonylcarbamoyl transferase component Bud32/predicted nucleotidyltransferase
VRPRLTPKEKSELNSVAESLIAPDKIKAVCAYGSKVAGYARQDSDYDILIVARNFREGARYRYQSYPVQSSALIVDEEGLVEDARRASLGEFVAGRLLNIYEPILNEELFRDVEVEYKKRVIAEALIEIESDYGEFSPNLIIPLEYFLFDKLKKRALVYPPALYSYARTYGCEEKKDNLAFALKGFRLAAEELRAKGILDAHAESVRVVSGKLQANALSKLVSMFSLTTRGATQYAVHGFAGRVSFSVFKTEALSKLKRMREKIEPPMELDRPRKLLRLEEGVVFDDASKMTEELARMAGFEGAYRHKVMNKGEIYTTTSLLELSNDGVKVDFVVKHFSDIKSVKWAILNMWALTAKKFSMSPLSRLQRHYEAVRRLREIGIMTPQIIGIALDERILVSKFVEGGPLSDSVQRIINGKTGDLVYIEKYGKTLAKLHDAGLALGDTKPDNVIVSNEEICLVDLEQAVEEGDKAWDLAEFLYYSAKLSFKGEAMMVIADAFLNGYRNGKNEQTIAKAKSIRYLAPFQPFLSPAVSKVIRDTMERYS